MKLAVMQPYFMPYIGYYQLIAAADLFIVYDNIKYTKKGWINRNRILRNGSDATISLPLKADSDFLNVAERRLAEDFKPAKLLAQIEGAYRAAPFFRDTMPLLEGILAFEDRGLFPFLRNSIERTCAHLGVATPIRASSTVAIDHGLKAQDKVLAFCAAAGADVYINPIGGVELYDEKQFAEQGVQLRFLRAKPLEYSQFGEPFVPWLSIIDVMMFNSLDMIAGRLRSGADYE
jgi:hypothetical protein